MISNEILQWSTCLRKPTLSGRRRKTHVGTFYSFQPPLCNSSLNSVQPSQVTHTSTHATAGLLATADHQVLARTGQSLLTSLIGERHVFLPDLCGSSLVVTLPSSNLIAWLQCSNGGWCEQAILLLQGMGTKSAKGQEFVWQNWWLCMPTHLLDTHLSLFGGHGFFLASEQVLGLQNFVLFSRPTDALTQLLMERKDQTWEVGF